MNTTKLVIQFDQDWLALNAYKQALRKIVEDYDAEPWAKDPEAANIAREALSEYPTTR